MKKNIMLLSISFFILFTACAQEKSTSEKFYQFNAKLIDGKTISMNDYKGKVILVVNTASKCGFTPQYEGLEKLYQKYKSKGFVILGFPCNQFGGQEPGNEEEISNFCSLKFNVTFPMFSKIEVNGDNADPIFKFLKTELPGTMGNDVKWNFTKFVLDKNGKPIKRFGSTTKPEDIDELIGELTK